MKKKYYFVLLFFFSTSNLVNGQRDSTQLNVENIHQITSTWCWAASIQMALKYFNVNSEQCEIVSKYDNRPNCDCKNDIKILKNCSLGEDYKIQYFRCAENLWPEKESVLYNFKEKLKNLNFKRDSTICSILKFYDNTLNIEIKGAGNNNNLNDFEYINQMLKLGKVILAYCNDSRHMVVIKGAYKNSDGKSFFIINDPFQKLLYKNFYKRIFKKASLCTSVSYFVNLKSGDAQIYKSDLLINSSMNYSFDKYLICGKD